MGVKLSAASVFIWFKSPKNSQDGNHTSSSESKDTWSVIRIYFTFILKYLRIEIWTRLSQAYLSKAYAHKICDQI